MKTLERLILRLLTVEVKEKLDPLQFAYKQHIGVNDAVLYMIHHALAHLEETGAYVRIMFFDFSGSFNTIQPNILKNEASFMDQKNSSGRLLSLRCRTERFKISFAPTAIEI